MAKINQQKSDKNINMGKPINNGSKSEIYQVKPGGKFKIGNPGGGKPIGSKSFSTLFDEAIKKIVKEKKLPITNPEVDLVVKAIVEALKGNYPFYRDIMDRKYGQPTKNIDMTTGGEPLFQPTPEERERALRALRDIND